MNELLEIRNELGESREVFARRIGVTAYTLWRLETGRTKKPQPLTQRAIDNVINSLRNKNGK